MRRALILIVGLLALPATLAAGFGLWNPAAAWQEHFGLELLLRLLLFLENNPLHKTLVGEGLVSTTEVGLLLGGVGLLFGAAAIWDNHLPKPVRWLIDVLEVLIVGVGAVTCAAILAVGAAIDRPLFWGGLAVGLLAARAISRDQGSGVQIGWRAPSNRLRRAGLVVGCTGAGYYGVTSLWEGATYKNPVFQIRNFWIAGPGNSPLTSALPWLGLGLVAGGCLLWLARRKAGFGSTRALLAASVVGVGVLVLSVVLSPSTDRALADALSAVGALVLAAGLGSFAATRTLPEREGLGLADPRQLLARALPLILWAAFCVVRGLTVSMWTPPQELPPGVEKIADADCVFSLAAGPSNESIFYTERCRTELGRLAGGQLQTWDLQRSGADRVEELGGPDATGTLWAAIQANALDANLVMVAVEGKDGPRSVPVESLGVERAQAVGLLDEKERPIFQTDADVRHPGTRAHIPLPDCWLSSWIPVPSSASGEVVLGCENRTGGLLFNPQTRAEPRQVDLSSRLESGAFSPAGDRLFGLSLWSDPYLHSYDWSADEPPQERARKLIGPFNWEVLTVPQGDGYRLWVPRFIEGSMLVLDPESLEIEAHIPLSFGIRAAHYDPVHKRVWAAASYSGELWSIQTEPPYEAEPIALCGQTRDMVSDASGRIVLSTDCGIYRIDPTRIAEGPVQ